MCPGADNPGERRQSPLRMIERTSPAQAPGSWRQNEPLQAGPAGPPYVPKRTQVLPSARTEISEIGCLEKSTDAKENRFDFVRPSTQRFQRQPLREKRERQLVLLIPE